MRLTLTVFVDMFLVDWLPKCAYSQQQLRFTLRS